MRANAKHCPKEDARVTTEIGRAAQAAINTTPTDKHNKKKQRQQKEEEEKEEEEQQKQQQQKVNEERF